MVPENFKFGGGATETIIHPLIAVLLLLAVAFIWFLPRKFVIAPLLLVGILVPYGQQLVVGTVHFPVLRILILAGCFRFSMSIPQKWDSFDKLFVLWAVCRAAAVILLFMKFGAFISQIGFLLDVLGGFFVLRSLIRDQADIRRTVQVLLAVTVVLAGCMLYEHFGGINLFGYLGGVPISPDFRLERLRAQGPFGHPILAGTFGATLLPLFVWLWLGARVRIAAAVGIIASSVITVMSASSTPVMAYAAAVLSICLWPVRRRLAAIRWAGIVTILVLALVMKAPIWFLLARVDIAGGSSGFHRAMLIDAFFRHFRDWWLVGTDSNADWGYFLWDTANQYVTEGETGGLAALVCFIALIVTCFRRIGTACRATRGNRRSEWLYWLLGATLVSHVVAFFGIFYFDQTRIAWLVLLAVVVAATKPTTENGGVPSPICTATVEQHA